MKQSIKLPLSSIFSLIQDMEEIAKNPATAEQFKNIQGALNMLKETFMPLIDEYKGYCMLPDIDATVDVDSDETENHEEEIDWEQKRFELIKAAMQARISALEKNFNFRSVMPSIAKESIEMADTMLKQLKGE